MQARLRKHHLDRMSDLHAKTPPLHATKVEVLTPYSQSAGSEGQRQMDAGDEERTQALAGDEAAAGALCAHASSCCVYPQPS